MEAIRLNPEYVKAHYKMCKIYYKIGDRKKALKEFEIIKKQNKDLAEELTLILKFDN